MSSRINGIKVGDRVRLKTWNEISDKHNLVIGFFERHQGKKGTVCHTSTPASLNITLDDGCPITCPKEIVEKIRFQLPEELFVIE